eukprot:scaffold581393_cov38-Prasinocladus_malaysianus.AAC.1
MRSAEWSIVSDTSTIAMLREKVPGSAPCYNHHQVDEPGDWGTELWGTNLPRLLRIKEQYDPDHRFNCWHCVGY